VIGQCLDHAILPIDLMRGRQKLAGRLLAQHVHASRAVSQMKGRVALPAFELQHLHRIAIALDVRLQVGGEPAFIEGVGGSNGR
jgi:hypothetical protein